MKKTSIIFISVLVVLMIGFRFFCGIFVVQPIGAVPKGATIIYWRYGLNLPFVASADGLIQDSGLEVSLLSRAVMLGGIAKPVVEREIFRLGYSEMLYEYSTGGVKYSK